MKIIEGSSIHGKHVSVSDSRSVPLTDEDLAIVAKMVMRSSYGTAPRIVSMMRADRDTRPNQFIDWFNTAKNEFGYTREEAVRLRNYYVREFAMRNVLQPIADCDKS